MSLVQRRVWVALGLLRGLDRLEPCKLGLCFAQFLAYHLRFEFKYDGGGIGKGATGTLFVDGTAVTEGRIAQTVGVRFSLDETFDVGSDMGTPVVEDYVDKMPFAFTGTLKKFVVVLEPENLTPEERKRLLEEEARASMSAH